MNGDAWSPSRVARVALRVIGNLSCQFEILQFVRNSVLVEVLPVNPRFAIKYAADDYLARDLSVTDRKACFLHHYKRLLGALPESILRRILHRSVPIFELHEEDGNVFRVMAHLSRPWDKEGELSLELELNGVGIYVISFSVVPGSIVKSRAPEVILISRLQGMRGKYNMIQRATKTMSDVAPSSFLLSALQGFAEAFDITEIVGVSAVRQAAYTEESGEIFRKSYDDFFISIGAVLGPENLFTCPVPIPEKPLQEVKRGHKLRTKEKRAFKRDVADTVRRFFQVNSRMRGGRSSLERTSDVPLQLVP